LRPWLAVSLAAVALAGCAGVPESGSVHVGRAFQPGSAVEPNDIRIIAGVPVRGMSPTRLVKGFVGALADSDGNYAVAKLYLAPGVTWHPSAGTILYDAPPRVQAGPHGVEVTVRRVGTVDSRGTFRAEPGTVHAGFTLVRSSGQWRISHLPAGILLSTSDAERTLQPATIYYFNHTQTRLVPEPVLVQPNAPGLATTLVRELVDGPDRDLAPGVINAFPHGTDLIGTVPIDASGVAEVDLSGSVQQVSSAQLQRLSAQIVWTLRQVTSVTHVRLLANGAPLTVAGVGQVQSIGAWPQFDPQAPPTSHGALFTRQGRIVGVQVKVPRALRGRHLRAPAISADGSTVAALRTNGHRITLLTGPADGRLRPRLSGLSLSAPAFDPQGDVFVSRLTGSSSRLVEVPTGAGPRSVRVPAAIAAAGISELAISRDGSRIAMIVGPAGRTELMVAVLGSVRGTTAVMNPRLVVSSAADVSGLAWAGGNQIVTTVAESGNRRAVIETDVDGYQHSSAGGVGLPDNPTQVAAAPGQQMLVTARGGIWALSGTRWRPVSRGDDPSYAG
jgi:hypothetical protein